MKPRELTNEEKAPQAQKECCMGKRVLVTTAWPYANGPLHLGHLAGSCLPADIFARYNRMIGNETLMVSGTDEHGTPISMRSEVEGRSPKEIVDSYHERIKRSLYDAGCSYDLFTRTTTKNHRDIAQDFFLKLLKHDFIYEKTMKMPYCPKCNKSLPDRYVEGKCPKCGSEGARGDQCDACGRTLDTMELINPYCKSCGTTPEIHDIRHYFFRLTAFQDRLLSWIKTKKDLWRPNVYKFTINWLKEGLEDRPITRDLKWGVPVPIKCEEDKVIYVWFEAVVGYISATKQYFAEQGKSDKWRVWWEDSDTETYYFIGKDNIPFHTIIWPAMLLGYGGLNIPTNVIGNEFLNLEGGKFSTSKNYAVWLDEYLEHFDPDPLRYYLSINMPESKDANFTWDEFQRRNNEELVSTFGNFAHRVLSFIERFHDGIIPEPYNLDEKDLSVLKEIGLAVDVTDNFLQNCEFKKAITRVMKLASFGNQYFNEMEPWKDKAMSKTTLHLSACIVKALAILIAPFLPFSAQRLWNMLGYECSVHEQRLHSAKNPIESQHIRDVKPLFRIIEGDEIAEQKTKLDR
ncbi:MAG: methionine--tRNA ligase [Methanocellales archaeon]|nr:methionine--tRNA ligase [Methanocellales archaeon]MDD3420974.1 methionine--tRNA ligase [Methanocellales archaeon]MDD4898283.1 methionine--tRNA ligase [Methanocellales archaeon]MDD5446806.1 methionine--tRNA ligase [Methanocellales archaeon]